MKTLKKLLSLCMVLALLFAPGIPANLAESIQTPSDLAPVVTAEPEVTETPSQAPTDSPAPEETEAPTQEPTEAPAGESTAVPAPVFEAGYIRLPMHAKLYAAKALQGSYVELAVQGVAYAYESAAADQAEILHVYYVDGDQIRSGWIKDGGWPRFSDAEVSQYQAAATSDARSIPGTGGIS